MTMPSSDFSKNGYNLTHNDRVHKYTLNLPLGLFEKAQAKARAAGIYRVSIYFRAIIEREVNSVTSLTINQIIDAQKESVRIASAEHRQEDLDKIDKRRRWSKFFKIFQPKQQFFNFKK